MKKLLLLTFFFCLAWTTQAQFEVAMTSFEEVTIEAGVNDGQYVDTGDAAAAHDLINNDGQTPVNAAGTGPFPLGYSASYVPYVLLVMDSPMGTLSALLISQVP